MTVAGVNIEIADDAKLEQLVTEMSFQREAVEARVKDAELRLYGANEELRDVADEIRWLDAELRKRREIAATRAELGADDDA